MESNQHSSLEESLQMAPKPIDTTPKIADQSAMPTEDYDPADLPDLTNGQPKAPLHQLETPARHGNSGQASGSPNMEPDITNWGNGDSLGNNDGTEPDPERVDLV